MFWLSSSDYLTASATDALSRSVPYLLSRWNLTASGPRPNPQGSYHYGLVNTTGTIRLANSRATINGKLRYAVNGISFVPADTPLKVADFYSIPGVFTLGSMPDNPTGGGAYLQTSVMAANMRDYVEVVFENAENLVQSWHIDGYAFWVVGCVFLVPYSCRS